MKKVYTIKKDHPVLESIRQEILNSPGYTKDTIGIHQPSIDDSALIYNRFNVVYHLLCSVIFFNK